jgi:imidazolonepropionase-like amidohydrolase
LALTAPEGGLISGQSAVLQLDGWTYEDLTLRAGVGLHVQWPGVGSVLGGNTSPDQDPLLSLQRLLQDVRAYQQAKNAGRADVDLRWEAMLPVLDGRMPLIVHADEIQRIQSSVAFADREKVRMIVYGGYDAPLCAGLLLQHKIPVIVGGIYRLPQRRSDGYDAAYTVPERLRQAGVPYCISSGQNDASNIRNLPYHAAMASAFGLPRDEALKAVTLYPAQILGVVDRVGSLDVGKDATLIVTTGDPLETTTQVQRAYIQGRVVDLNDRHKRLYHKYSEKYKRLRN